MANVVTKIERTAGMATRVEQLYLVEKIQTAKGIAERLRHDGFKISDASVARYLSRVKDDFRSASRKVVYDHVQNELPKDLDALEEMEARCLEWTREDISVVLERTASAAAAISGEVDQWIGMILSCGPDEKPQLVKKIIKKCMAYIAMTDEKLDNRLKAIKQAASIIELKLKHATGLDKDQDGNIIIVDRSGEYYRNQDGGGGVRAHVKAVIGGKNA